jgi:hypothetical protein
MMRVLFGVFLFPALASSACGMISGVAGYEEFAGSGDASVSQLTKDTGVATGHDAVGSREDTGAPPLGDANNDVLLSDEATSADGAAAEAGGGTDAPADVGVPEDAADLADVAPDAPPPACGPMTCSHCCSGGVCVGGKSVTTCGTGGAECKDCTSMGGACGSNGSCTTPVPDAAPPPACSPNQCNGCGFAQRGCCKSDETCGCQWIYVPGSGCN